MNKGRFYSGKNSKQYDIVTNTSPQISAISYDSVSIIWDNVPNATSYEVFVGSASSGPWTSHGITSGTDYVVDNLTQSTKYFFNVVSKIVSENGVIVVQTTSASQSYFKELAVMQAFDSNAMILDPGVLPMEGAIPAQGRTYLGQISVPWNTAHSEINGLSAIYGIRFLFTNLRSNIISGGKMVVGRATGANGGGIYLPEDNFGNLVNSLTEAPLSGWCSVKINGDRNLIVPASTNDMMGAIWSDWLIFPTGISTDFPNNLVWRFFHPGQNSATDYALSYASWGDNAWEKFGTVGGFGSSWLRIKQSWVGWPWSPPYYYSEGDGATNPSTMTQVDFNDQASPDDIGAYGPPGPASFPFMTAQYLTEVI